jgi:hypothetical protein
MARIRKPIKGFDIKVVYEADLIALEDGSREEL